LSIEAKNEKLKSIKPTLLEIARKLLLENWKLKLVSLLVAITIWGALISEDASLTREKVFQDVAISITGTDALQRSGLIVTQGLDELQPIRVRVEIPQKMYDAAVPANYSIRADVSRITSTGEQTVPIQSISTNTYGSVEWMSQNEITVVVEEYITRRRVPVRLEMLGKIPEGYYSSGTTVDPGNVVISGPQSLVEKIAYVSASYNPRLVESSTGVQYTAVPFRLIGSGGEEIISKHISVTSENVVLDTLLVEQSIYPTKLVDVNLSGITRGEVMDGYTITSITADPAQIRVAGSLADLNAMKMLDLATTIDVTNLTESIIRAVRVDKPNNLVDISDSAVYVSIEVSPMEQAAE